MDWICSTKKRGLKLAPEGEWDGIDKDYVFVITGESDADWTNDPETRLSVGGGSVSLNGAIISTRCSQQSCVALSTCKAELYALTEVVKDCIQVKNVLEGMELKVKLPIEVECDNRRTVALVNGFGTGGRTRHFDTETNYLQNQKLEKIILYKWKSGKDLPCDIFTKNLSGEDFDRCAARYITTDTEVEKFETSH